MGTEKSFSLYFWVVYECVGELGWETVCRERVAVFRDFGK